MQANSAGTRDYKDIHRSCIVVDLHADTPVLVRFGYDLSKRHDPPLPGGALGGNIDLPRMRQGGLAAQFFGLVSFPRHLPFGWGGPFRTVNRLIDSIEASASQNNDQLILAQNSTQIRKAHAQGKIAGLLGIEGAHCLEGDLSRVQHFAKRGVVYLGLLHFSKNEAGAPAFGHGRDDQQGLTDFGYQLVDELNRNNILIDLAHINRKGFLQAAARSKAPVIVSHTGVKNIHQHWRNIDEDQIRAVAQTQGCIGVIFSRKYLGRDNLDGVCAHLEHLMTIGGENLPALGSDFDGLVTPPHGLEDVSCLPNLTKAMLRWGFNETQLRKILGENILRVLSDIEG